MNTNEIIQEDIQQEMVLGHHGDVGAKPTEFRSFPVKNATTSSPCKDSEIMKRPKSLLDPEARLKLTILSLSGIKVRKNTRRKDYHQSKYSTGGECTAPKPSTKSFAITASVCFTGSCDPKDMLVVSSGLCSATGKLSVESKPVVVPNGMTDGLIAVWEDSPKTTYYHHQGSIYSTENILFGKTHGSITACPESRPHLFVNLRDNSLLEQTSNDLIMLTGSNMGKTQDSTAVSSLSFGPEMDETEISSCPSVHSYSTRFMELQKIQESSTLTDLETNHTLPRNNLRSMYPSSNNESRIPSLRPSPTSESCHVEDYNFSAVINTPSQTMLESSSVPEILEMHISLGIHEVPLLNHSNVDPGHSISDSIQSSCVSTPEGGGAVAHLVLFPDILGEQSHPECDGYEEDDCYHSEEFKILEIPVRKRLIPLIRSSSSVSGLTSRCDTTGSASRNRRFTREPEAYVDLDENAVIRVKIELCREDDIQSLGGNESLCLADDFQDCTTHNSDERDRAKESAIYSILEEQVVDGNVHTPQNTSLEEGQMNDVSAADGQEREAQSNRLGNTKDNLEQTKTSSVANILLCSPRFDFSNLIQTVSGMLMNCSDDVRGFQNGDAASMDSTIYTAGSINM